jgi:hypothetical protein
MTGAAAPAVRCHSGKFLVASAAFQTIVSPFRMLSTRVALESVSKEVV